MCVGKLVGISLLVENVRFVYGTHVDSLSFVLTQYAPPPPSALLPFGSSTHHAPPTTCHITSAMLEELHVPENKIFSFKFMEQYNKVGAGLVTEDSMLLGHLYTDQSLSLSRALSPSSLSVSLSYTRANSPSTSHPHPHTHSHVCTLTFALSRSHATMHAR
jgi:hypothetical protein